MSKPSKNRRRRKYHQAGIRGKKGKFINWMWLAFRFDEQQGLCFFCKTQMVLRSGSEIELGFIPNRASLDHVVALRFKEGKHTFKNVVASCCACNRSRDTP